MLRERELTTGPSMADLRERESVRGVRIATSVGLRRVELFGELCGL